MGGKKGGGGRGGGKKGEGREERRGGEGRGCCATPHVLVRLLVKSEN
jgi:hypothetical protein